MLVFLGTVAGFYWVLGVALATGLLTVAGDLGAWLSATTGTRVQVAVGVLLLATGVLMPTRKKGEGAARRAGGCTAGATGRWVSTGARRHGALVGLAVAAAGIEAASMIPYLAGIGIVTSAPVGAAERALVLAGYCVVMVLPALLLLGLRLGLGRRLEPVLRRVAAWMERTSGETVAWVLAIVGLLILSNAGDAGSRDGCPSASAGGAARSNDDGREE
ncbi:GAP family protein [Janibacter melonis]|uniref:GAP family protein n=1 Tax=Janibacter melonis TaxID=262209 RepID=UPI0020957DF6|nr:GAP family protein [Janibacter melonis]